jgi:iron complex transport system substrate-binding protein
LYRRHTGYSPSVRVCSLLPSATEIVGALGLTDSLVGVSHECDWPPEARRLPTITASRVDTTTLASAEIDTAVRDALADGLPLYAVDAELIEQLAPDLIVTQDTCAVCAVSTADVREVCLVQADVLSLDARSIAGIEESVEVLAAALGVPEQAEPVVAEMRRGIRETNDRVTGLTPKRVFMAEWLDPPFAAGHWVPEMVELAGGIEVLGRAGEPSYPTTWEEVAERGPDLVVVAPCGFDAERAAAEARKHVLPARAFAVDANAYYSRPAPRIADGIAQLAFLLHPEAAPDPGLPQIEL